MSRMTHRARGGILVRALPLAVLVLCASPAPPARADAWGDARKAFRAAQRAEEMETRRNAFVPLLEFDGTDAVEEIFRALAREENPAVVLTAIQTLSTFQSEEAVKALEQAVRAEKGERRVQALIALADRPGEEGKTALLDALVDKEEPVVAQAALALGRKQVKDAVPGLVALLSSPTWQVRAAAARGLRLMAGGPVIDPQTAKEVLHPPPAWLDVKALLPPLARSLATAEGRDRSDLVETLERLTAPEVRLRPRGVDAPARRARTRRRSPPRRRPSPSSTGSPSSAGRSCS